LVRFNQSKSFDDKEKYYLEMSKKYPSEHPRILESKFFSIFSHWYYAAILELIRLDNFRENPHWISRALKPNVPVLDIRKAIEDLLELGLLLRNKKGALERTDKSITTPEGVSDVAIIKYQQQLTRLAQMSIERDEVEHKESSTMTVALSNDTFKKVKGKMKEFHLEILKLIEDQDDNKTTIANINLQMFKLMNEGA